MSYGIASSPDFIGILAIDRDLYLIRFRSKPQIILLSGSLRARRWRAWQSHTPFHYIISESLRGSAGWRRRSNLTISSRVPKFNLFILSTILCKLAYIYQNRNGTLIMDTFLSDIDSNSHSYKRDIGIVIAVLESGNSVELKASGYSMFPTLRPGDRVIVKPITKGELPKPGNVVVYIENGLKAQRRNGVTEERRNGVTEERHNNITTEQHNVILVMHRLIGIRVDDQGNPQLVTRGDSLNEPDKPWPQQKLLGIAVTYKRRDKEHSLKSYIPGDWRYKFNHRLIWLYIKMKNFV